MNFSLRQVSNDLGFEQFDHSSPLISWRSVAWVYEVVMAIMRSIAGTDAPPLQGALQ